MAKVLVLNLAGRPTKIISARKAFNMIQGNAESDEPDVWPATNDIATTFRSANAEYPIPSVIYLKDWHNVPNTKISWSKQAVLKRDNYTCIYCGKQAQGREQKEMTVEHIHPQSRGGRDTWSNTACACFKCNQRKADRTPREAGMKLLWEPKRPRTNYVLASGKIPEAWKMWLGGTEFIEPVIRNDDDELEVLDIKE